MSNWETVEPDGLPTVLPKIDHPVFAQCFHNILVNVRVTGEVPPAMEKCDHQGHSQKEHRIVCNNYRGIPLVAHARKGVVENRPVPSYQLLRNRRTRPGGTVRLPPRTINDRLQFVVRRFQELGRHMNPPVHVLHRSAESIRLCRSRAAVAGTHTLWRTNHDGFNDPQFPRRNAGPRAYG